MFQYFSIDIDICFLGCDLIEKLYLETPCFCSFAETSQSSDLLTLVRVVTHENFRNRMPR